MKALFKEVIPSFAKANGELELLDLNLGSRTEFIVKVPTKGGSTAAVFKVDPESGRLLVLYDLEEKVGVIHICQYFITLIVKSFNGFIIFLARKFSILCNI